MTAVIALGAGLLQGAPAAAEFTVTVDGLVARAGAQALQPGARLFDAAHAAGVRADAYLLGAAWLRRDELKAQRALKVGLLFDLRVVEQGAAVNGLGAQTDDPLANDPLADDQRADDQRADDQLADDQLADDQLAALAARLAAQVREMPISGRRVNTLDPVRLEIEPASNRPLAAGDRLLYPPRPTTITVTGAVLADCVLPFAGLRPATAYAADCPRHAAAETDWLYVIQPDGVVLRRGIAGWNREPAQPLAPGARVYVPLRAELLAGRAEGLNDDFAAFLATQPLPLGEEGR